MSPKIKMSDIHDDRDDDIIELSDEELKEILADEDFDDSEEYGEMTEIMPVPRNLILLSYQQRAFGLFFAQNTTLHGTNREGAFLRCHVYGFSTISRITSSFHAR